ncbi:MAG: acetyl-CoA carboxylase biotin carboxyl carrier protein subunit [Bacteriovoracaceae bacterium]
MEKKFLINGLEVTVENYKKDQSSVSFTLNGKSFNYSLISKHAQEIILEGQTRFKANVGKQNRDGESIVMAAGREGIVSVAGKKLKKSGGGAGSLTSPMPGKIFKIVKDVGSAVTKGETILILEAMKMEHSIRADKDGKVKKIMFKTGELVQGGVTLAEVE